jgi:hypothetical protein
MLEPAVGSGSRESSGGHPFQVSDCPSQERLLCCHGQLLSDGVTLPRLAGVAGARFGHQQASPKHGQQAQSTAHGGRTGQGGGKRGFRGGALWGVAEAADAGDERGWRCCWAGGGWVVRAGGVGVDLGARDDVLVDAV